jgi:hypothetical protein
MGVSYPAIGQFLLWGIHLTSPVRFNPIIRSHGKCLSYGTLGDARFLDY